MRLFHEILAAVLSPDRIRRWAKRYSKDADTIGAWKRAAPTDFNPTATGRLSIFDAVDWALHDIHPTHPAEAREIALRYVHTVDKLDEKEGKRTSVCHALAKTVKEYTDIILLRVDNEENENMTELFREVTQLQTAVNQLSACVKEQLKTGD